MTRLNTFEAPVIALVQGASRGIGLGLVKCLLEDPTVDMVWASSRDPFASDGLRALDQTYGDRLMLVEMDILDEDAIREVAHKIKQAHGRLDLLLNVTGLLHDATTGMTPERSLRELNLDHMRRSFDVNAIGPALVIKHMHTLMRTGQRAVIANLSARVGSIGDNQLGGWYGYRASKAAQNQLTKTASIELRRKAPQLLCVALHPGTVDTSLSEPFQGNVKPEKLFDVPRAAAQLLEVLDGLGPQDTGTFWDWAGEAIQW